MPNRNLIKQLNSLKDLRADNNFRKENKNILLNQIYSGDMESANNSFNWVEVITKKIPLDAFKMIPHSAFVGAFVLVFMFGSGLFGMHVAQNAKPGDSLYIAKIAKEKTQFVFTFDEKKKVELGLEFAGNRAKELALVLEEHQDEKNNSENEKNEKVSKLVDDFKKEIKNVKVRINKINEDKEKDDVDEKIEEETEVFSASVQRDEKGIKISDNEKISGQEVVTNEDEKNTENSEEKISSTTEEKIEDETEVEVNESQDPEGIIDEAKELLEGDNYNELLDKMEEAETAIDNVDYTDDNGIEEIKEDASSTEDVLEVEEDIASSSEK